MRTPALPRGGMTHNRRPYCSGCFIPYQGSRKYLPRISVEAHTTILSTTSRTTLTQTYANPRSDVALDECSYSFPLYDGVSVVAFSCTVGSRVVKGVVKERQEAKEEYKAAKGRGETAGLFERSLDAADVFVTRVGNVPAKETVKVEITYLGELKHDAEVDGTRFTIPTTIAPRFGGSEQLQLDYNSALGPPRGHISVIVDAEMTAGSSIKSIQSPSHPISVNIGTVSTSSSAEPSLQKASASLALDTAELDNDLVFQIVATNSGDPSAILETHPSVPNQRALMATLVPKFNLPPEKPEVVFVCDRSGSMGQGKKIPNLISALQIFLKSLPVGCKFNICSFGNRFSFLWPKSKTYSQETVDEAVKHVSRFSADMGGTHMYDPMEKTFSERWKDMNLEVFLMTDGEIWDQDHLFELINKNVADSNGAIRVFTLGVGRDASSALIEGAARAGNGFSQTVGENEKMDKKVVRMLKGALTPHIKDYTLEVKYDKITDDDFEVIDKVMDALDIESSPKSDAGAQAPTEQKPISLFNPDLQDDIDMSDAPAATNTKYDHLPTVPEPRYLQAPFEIPALFPFNRTNVYVLMSDSTPGRDPSAVVLRGTSKHGPLELVIPISILGEKGKTIHQLAARKAIQDLEEGRGWLSHAKDQDGKLLKETHEGRFSDMVEREVVRLGVQYQVGGKWCSFVAVQEKDAATGEGTKELGEAEIVKPAPAPAMPMGMPRMMFASSAKRAAPGGPPRLRKKSTSSVRAAQPAPAAPASSQPSTFGSSATLSYGDPFAAHEPARRGVGSFDVSRDMEPASFGDEAGDSGDSNLDELAMEETQGINTSTDSTKTSDPDALHNLASLQTFIGSWTWSEQLEKILGVAEAQAMDTSLPASVDGSSNKKDVMATLCAVVFLRKKLAGDKDAWEMLVDKAEEWLRDQTKADDVGDLEKAVDALF